MRKVEFVLKIVVTGQSVKMKEKQRYALADQDQIKGEHRLPDNQIGTYCIVMSGRGPKSRSRSYL